MDDAGQWGVSRTFTSEQIRRRQVQYIHNAGTGSNHLNVDIEELECLGVAVRGAERAASATPGRAATGRWEAQSRQ